jgi:hypothetical protein
VAKGDREWLLTETDLQLRLGRKPTDEEIQLDIDTKIIDRAGGKVNQPPQKRKFGQKGKHGK